MAECGVRFLGVLQRTPLELPEASAVRRPPPQRTQLDDGYKCPAALVSVPSGSYLVLSYDQYAYCYY